MADITLITHYDLTVFRGGEKFIINLANSLSELGHKVKIISYPFKRGKVNIDDLLKNNIEYIADFSFKNIDSDVSYYIYAPLIYELLLRDKSAKKIAGLHGFALSPELSSPDIWRVNPIRFYKLHGFKASVAFYYFKLSRNRDLFRFKKLHIVNPYMRRFLCGELSSKTTYIPPLTNYSCNMDDIDDQRGDYFKILMLGNNSYTKGGDICEKVVSYLASKVRELRIKFVSNFPLRVGSVEYTGFIEEGRLPEVLKRSNVVLYPSRLDTFGMTIIESLNCGTPVITSDIPAHRIFSYPVIRCSTIADYLSGILHLFYEWRRGTYNTIRKKALEEGRKYSKQRVFPKYLELLLH